ncbi:hypothetical protein PVAP13_9KG593401 [Panicum virgatum]|uniref:Uncharacterized protein n=1 Tax=Panicum virgatum TaxID=38727 RepID=A0A8T0P135_PANVG|nr:hypothetical protein PVAP13_9KG593401 [Panicum virgatum]
MGVDGAAPFQFLQHLVREHLERSNPKRGIFTGDAAPRGSNISVERSRSRCVWLLISLVTSFLARSHRPTSSRHPILFPCAPSSCRAGKGRSSRRRRRVVPRLPLLLFPRPRPTLKPPSVSPLLRFPRFHRGPAPPLLLLLPHGKQSTAALAPS